ncbi:alpha/beta hydrolase [Aspergillus ruber CBS 135680]|uniref:Putative lipase n=1 Tax=Aspergillus ruber (strain CBS 135680) TaxID=1388766 RepID=A0A017S9D8_ASPRC|nr:putative lipase [Aspergillus ruber CBS 135680]EYE93653.1 putative lipase [Aspergillus ruber CBS 135680]
MASSRWWLFTQAVFWRFLMRIGMFIHDIASPRPPSPSFTRSIPSGDDDSTYGTGAILHFYCPPGYYRSRKEGRRLPVVVNFHGGGFTLGCATDDGRWARCVIHEVGAVVVSVAYRRAPEHPFPAAVDDGVDALQYLARHAGELGLDVSRIVLSGFSAGGNLAVTVPLRLRDRMVREVYPYPASTASTSNLSRADSTQKLVDMSNDLHIVGLFCWYPILDFEESRDHRRARSAFPDKTLPRFFTNLFDEAYLPDFEERKSPYASPIRAPDAILADALPHDIYLYICEWDMLLNEGQLFVRRLQDLGKRVRAMMIEKAIHAWDKSPNPFRDQDKVDILYSDACADMKTIFER